MSKKKPEQKGPTPLPKPPKGPTPPVTPNGFPPIVFGSSDDCSQAVVRMEDGVAVLYDPAAEGVMAAVDAHNYNIAKMNCMRVFNLNADRIAHFKSRAVTLGKSDQDVVIVIINVDDVHGRDLAEALMPGQESMWQGFRDNGETPYARGLAARDGIQNCMNVLDKNAAEKMRLLPGLLVVVVDHGTAEVFQA